MSLVRILVDGQGLLQNWAEVAPGKPRQSTLARRELTTQLTNYFDAAGIPLTIAFDGHSPDQDDLSATPDVEVIFCKRGQTVIQALERVADKYRNTGTVLVVTDSPLAAAPATQRQAQSTAEFARVVTTALADLARNISRYNEESQRFNRTA